MLTSSPLLIPLASPAADEKGRIPLPTKILVAPWGKSTALDGTAVIVDDETLAVLSSNQIKLGRVEIALDFEHNTVPGDKAKADPHKVAAYGTLSAEKGSGLFFHPTFWTPEGSDHYTGCHYRDISPTVIRDNSGRVIALHSVALTRAGQIEGLHAFSAALSDKIITALSANTPNSPDPEKIDAMKELLCSLLGLDPESATDEEITAAATAALAAKKEPGEKEEPSEPTPMSAASARIDSLERRLILSDAKLAGKLIPFSSATADGMDIKTLSAVIADLKPGAVPTDARTNENPTDGGGQLKALSAEDEQVCNLLGIDKEKYQKQLATA